MIRREHDATSRRFSVGDSAEGGVRRQLQQDTGMASSGCGDVRTWGRLPPRFGRRAPHTSLEPYRKADLARMVRKALEAGPAPAAVEQVA